MKSRFGQAPTISLLICAGILAFDSGCSRVLDAQGDGVEEALAAVTQAGYQARQDGLLPADPADVAARKTIVKRVLIEPLRQMGWDPDRSLQRLAGEYRAGTVPAEKRDVVAGLLQTYAASRADLVQFGFISPETALVLEQI